VRNSAALFGSDGGLQGVYHKVRLVPMAEYLPGRGRFALSDWTFRQIERFAGFGPELVPGTSAAPLRWDPEAPPFGVLLCYDAAYADLARAEAREGARFLVNLSNEGWYGSAELDQMLDLCRFRAVETRRGLFRCVNTGISAYVNPWGEVEGRLVVDGRDRDVRGTFTHRVHVRSDLTPYARVGDPLGWAGLVVFLSLGLLAPAVRGAGRLWKKKGCLFH
jgi:apolipoprotein N-acyltransferase